MRTHKPVKADALITQARALQLALLLAKAQGRFRAIEQLLEGGQLHGKRGHDRLP